MKFLILFLIPFIVNAERVDLPYGSQGEVTSPYDTGCILLNLFGSSAAVGPGSQLPAEIFWVLASSPTTGVIDNNTNIIIRDSNTVNDSSYDIARIQISSTSAPTYVEFFPPIISTSGFVLDSDTTTIEISACFLFKSTRSIARVMTPVNQHGDPASIRDAGCVPTRIGYSNGVTASLLSTATTGGFPPAASLSGTLVYWVQSSSAATGTGVSLEMRSTNTANTTSPRMIPRLLFNQTNDSSTANTSLGRTDGRYYRFSPPFRSSNTISYNVGATGSFTTLCTRGVVE